MNGSIYFDYNATTALDPQVRAAMLPFLDDIWGNPSSIHHVGRKARALLDQARERAAQVLRCKSSEVVFTSGGTESANLAIIGTANLLKSKGRHIITSSVEHHAVLHSCDYLERKHGFIVTRLPVSREGIVSVDSLREAFRTDTILVSIMAANNEVGSIQPIAELGTLCRERGVVFHTDAVQWFGKQPFENIHCFEADLVSICAHKIHGPKGAGALYIKSPLHPDPILFGGAHENERRAGTENLAGIVGLVESLERFTLKAVFDSQSLQRLTDILSQTLVQLPGVQIVSPKHKCLSNTLSFVVEDTDSIALLAGLDMEGICASSGSACSAGSLEPSHVILAMGFESKLANALVRLSLGRASTQAEVEYAARILPDIIRRAQLRQQPTRKL